MLLLKTNLRVHFAVEFKKWRQIWYFLQGTKPYNLNIFMNRSIKHELRVFWIASKTIHFIPILSLCLRKNFWYRWCISRENRGKRFVRIYVCLTTYKKTPSRLWFSLWFVRELLMVFELCMYIVNTVTFLKPQKLLLLFALLNLCNWAQCTKFTLVSSSILSKVYYSSLLHQPVVLQCFLLQFHIFPLHLLQYLIIFNYSIHV